MIGSRGVGDVGGTGCTGVTLLGGVVGSGDSGTVGAVVDARSRASLSRRCSIPGKRVRSPVSLKDVSAF